MCGLTYSQNERVGPMAWKYIYVSVVPVSRRQNSIVQKSNVRVVDDKTSDGIEFNILFIVHLMCYSFKSIEWLMLPPKCCEDNGKCGANEKFLIPLKIMEWESSIRMRCCLGGG